MAKQLQLRRGTTAQHSTFTGAAGEVTIDTDKKVVVVHDGSTAGGIPLAKQTTVDTKVDKVTSTDNAIVRYDGTSGAIQNSSVYIDDSGNVGIGVGNPSSSLTVKDGITLVKQFNNATARPAITPGVQKYGVHCGTDVLDDGFLRLSAGGGTSAYAKSYIDLSGYSIVPDMDRNIVFGTNGSERMRINQSGNLLVGTTTDNGVNKLQVNGSISANGAVRMRTDVIKNFGIISSNNKKVQIRLSSSDNNYLMPCFEIKLHQLANTPASILASCYKSVGTTIADTRYTITGGDGLITAAFYSDASGRICLEIVGRDAQYVYLGGTIDFFALAPGHGIGRTYSLEVSNTDTRFN